MKTNLGECDDDCTYNTEYTTQHYSNVCSQPYLMLANFYFLCYKPNVPKNDRNCCSVIMHATGNCSPVVRMSDFIAFYNFQVIKRKVLRKTDMNPLDKEIASNVIRPFSHRIHVCQNYRIESKHDITLM